MIRDITLDGNTFRNSHSVDKRHVVAYGGYGVAVMYGRWKFAAARYHSTRVQRPAPIAVFGSHHQPLAVGEGLRVAVVPTVGRHTGYCIARCK